MLKITIRDQMLREQRRLHDEALDKIYTKPQGVNAAQHILDASFEDVLTARVNKLRREYALGNLEPSVSVIVAHDAVNEVARQHELDIVEVDDIKDLVGRYVDLTQFSLSAVVMQFTGGRLGLTLPDHTYTRFVLRVK